MLCCDTCIHQKTCDYHDEIIKPLKVMLDRPKDAFLTNLQECVETFRCEYCE